MIEINNLSGCVLDKKTFSTVAKKVLSGENRTRENISLAFVNTREIKKLNKKFRKKNKPTDVLSFDLSAGAPFGSGSALGGKDYLGEIIICPEIVKENAKKYGVPIKKEMLKVFIHGILHLCGYDHEGSEKMAQEMEKKQEKYLSKSLI